MQTILELALPIFLNWLLQFVEQEVASLKAAHDTDVARGQTDTTNVQNYQAAKTRADKIKAAQDLLNRSVPTP